MYNKYNRSSFIQTKIVYGIQEKDLLLSNWDLFSPKRGYQYGYFSESEVNRPDLLSFKYYKRSDYWWIIAKFNPEIQDWWNDTSINMRVKLPNETDIEEFYLKVKSRLKLTS